MLLDKSRGLYLQATPLFDNFISKAGPGPIWIHNHSRNTVYTRVRNIMRARSTTLFKNQGYSQEFSMKDGEKIVFHQYSTHLYNRNRSKSSGTKSTIRKWTKSLRWHILYSDKKAENALFFGTHSTHHDHFFLYMFTSFLTVNNVKMLILFLSTI